MLRNKPLATAAVVVVSGVVVLSHVCGAAGFSGKGGVVYTYTGDYHPEPPGFLNFGHDVPYENTAKMDTHRIFQDVRSCFFFSCVLVFFLFWRE